MELYKIRLRKIDVDFIPNYSNYSQKERAGNFGTKN
jgi:hypothetical protein